MAEANVMLSLDALTFQTAPAALEQGAQAIRAGETVFDLGGVKAADSSGVAMLLAWQRRADRADASCVAVWPRKTGWLQVQDKKAGAHAIYVYAPTDWPQWQASQRRDATARYAARTPAAAAEGPTRAMPAWPFALAFTLAMLALWWRERR